MARFTKAVCKLCRREGEKLFLKGERCYSSKCAIEHRNYPPGMHGKSSQFRRRVSDYALQLREKQKARRIYGVLERQFRRYFKIAAKMPGKTGATLIVTLERRLDNVVFRLGFATSRAQARQLVQHGHFCVNGRRTNIPSLLVKPGDLIEVREQSKKLTYFNDLVQELAHVSPPDWLRLDMANASGEVLSIPNREEISVPFDEQLIVEYYNR